MSPEESNTIKKKDLCEILQKHLDLIQQSIDKYDNIGMMVRNFAITLWTATIAAGFIQKELIGTNRLSVLIGVSIFVTFILGIYDEVYKTYREGYKDIRTMLASRLQNGSCSLNDISFPHHPEGGQLIREAARSFFDKKRVHVNFLYWLLIGVSIIIALLLHFKKIS